MTNDTECREVARRLREAASYYESMGRDVDFYPVENAIGLEAVGEIAYTIESVRSLADLIDPDTTSEQTNHDESSLSASLINRDALLALVEELERPMRDGGYSKRIARRIREALGVRDD